MVSAAEAKQLIAKVYTAFVRRNRVEFDVTQLDMSSRLRLKTLFTQYPLLQTQAFYTRVLGPLQQGDAPVSFRILKWLCTSYSVEESVVYELQGQRFDLHQEYTSLLKLLSVRHFDPFRRGENKVVVKYGGKELTTTCAQLAFCAWAQNNKIIHYARENVKAIFKHKKEAHKSNKQRKRKAAMANKPAKRQRIIQVKKRSMVTMGNEIIIKW
jgi:hypothetical protein